MPLHGGQFNLLMRVMLMGLLLSAGPSLACPDGDGLDQVRRAAWIDAMRYLARSTSGPDIDRVALIEVSKRLSAFEPAELFRRARYENLSEHAEPLKPRLQHALRSSAYLRRLGKHLGRGPEICLLLGSDREEHWVRAIIEILREPLGEPIGEVAEILSTDEHGVVRLGAGRVARYVNAFCRGRGSEWGDRVPSKWDPTPSVRRIAHRLLDDRNPAVACCFALYDAYAFEDKAIIDMLVARLGDKRQRPAVKSGFLSGSERTVGDACRFTLHAQFIFYRKDDEEDAWGGLPLSKEERARLPNPQRRITSLPIDDSPASIARWWSKVRDTWSFRPDGLEWKTVFDDTVVMQRSAGRSIKTRYGEVLLTMPLYDEGWRGGDPRFSIRVEARAKDERLYVDANMGNPSHYLGYVSRGETGSGDAATVTSIMYAPATPEGVRVRMRIWTHKPPPPVGHASR